MSKKLHRELSRQLRGFKYEVGDNGEIVFPKSNLVVFGVATVENLTKRDGVSVGSNTVVNSALNFILDLLLGSATKISNWYMPPIVNNVTPSGSWAMSDVVTNEFTNYTEAVRQAFTPAAAAAGVISNAAARAEITIGSGAQDTIYALAITQASAQSSATGRLIAAARLGSARTGLEENDVIALGYSLTLADNS